MVYRISLVRGRLKMGHAMTVNDTIPGKSREQMVVEAKDGELY